MCNHNVVSDIRLQILHLIRREFLAGIVCLIITIGLAYGGEYRLQQTDDGLFLLETSNGNLWEVQRIKGFACLLPVRYLPGRSDEVYYPTTAERPREPDLRNVRFVDRLCLSGIIPTTTTNLLRIARDSSDSYDDVPDEVLLQLLKAGFTDVQLIDEATVQPSPSRK